MILGNSQTLRHRVSAKPMYMYMHSSPSIFPGYWGIPRFLDLRYLLCWLLLYVHTQ